MLTSARRLQHLLGDILDMAVTFAFSEESLRERPFEWATPPDRMAERAKRFAEKQQRQDAE